MKQHLPALVAALSLAFVGCGGGGGTPVTAPAYEAFRAQPTACGAERPDEATDMQFESPGDAAVSGTVTAILHTSCGRIVLELDASSAPATVNSFVFLAEEGYFDGTVSHRVIPGFVIQAGDPTATGRGNPGYSPPDELPSPDFNYLAGSVAMANAGPNSAGSQFFLVLADIDLPPDFTAFGSVVEGFDVMERIAGLPLAASPGDFQPSRPLETIYLERVEIAR